jgi:hypothetical protein
MNFQDLDSPNSTDNSTLRFWIIAVLVLQPIGYIFLDFPSFLAGNYLEGGIATVAKVAMIAGAFLMLQMQMKGLKLYLLGKVIKFLGILLPLALNWDDKVLEVELALVEQGVDFNFEVSYFFIIGIFISLLVMSIFPIIFIVNREKFENA